MKTLIRFLFTMLAAAPPAFAQLTLLEEGGTFLPGNLALAPAGTAFAKDVLPGFAAHTIPHLNDATYGNANSWISNSADSFAGINLGATPVAVNRIAFGRDNLGVFGDRCVDLYTIQYTTEANPTEATAAWTVIGTVDYRAGGLGVANPARRHAFSFPRVNATGLRIVALTVGTCIDEIEIANVVTGAPTDLALTATSITENSAPAATVGTLSATDEDAADTHVFAFAGGADDAAFTITGNTLKLNASADFETKPSYAIRIRATDSSVGMLTFEKSFTITVTNLAESAPTGLNGTGAGGPTFIPENNAPGFTVRTVVATGPDAGVDFTYAFAGGADDAAFTLTGNVVRINGTTSLATKQSYTIRIRATNAHAANLFYEQDFTFYVGGKVLDVQFDDASVTSGDQTFVNIGVQFVGDVNNFVLKNKGITPMTVNVQFVAPEFTVAAVGGSGTGHNGGTGSGSTGSTGSTGNTGSGSGSGSGGTLATVNIDPGQTAFVTLTYNDSLLGHTNLNIFEVLSAQQADSAFIFRVVLGNPRGNTVENDTFTATSGVTTVAPLANDGSPEVTITRVVGGNATVSADGRHLLIAAGFTGTLRYVTSNDLVGTVTIVAGTPVATPKKWAGLLHDANGKVAGHIAANATNGKYTAALNVGHVKQSAKFIPATPIATKLGALNVTLDGANHLQVTLGTNTGDLRPLAIAATATKYNAALQAIQPDLLGGGFSKLAVKKSGGITATGTLPDGTKFSTASALADDASASFYTPVKATKPKGTIAGEVAFAALAATDLTGEFAWVKPAQTKPTGLNASGVDTLVTLNGSIVVPAAAPTGLDADVELLGANFNAPLAFSVPLINGKAAPNDLLRNFTINGKTGDISGGVVFTPGGKVVKFKGVFLPKNDRIWGFLKGDVSGGRIDGELD